MGSQEAGMGSRAGDKNVVWEECLKHRKDVVLPTVKESNPGGGH